VGEQVEGDPDPAEPAFRVRVCDAPQRDVEGVGAVVRGRVAFDLAAAECEPVGAGQQPDPVVDGEGLRPLGQRAFVEVELGLRPRIGEVRRGVVARGGGFRVHPALPAASVIRIPIRGRS
jgi:hypothetical protein